MARQEVFVIEHQVHIGQSKPGADAAQIMRRGHAGSGYVAIKLLSIDSNFSTDLGKTSMIGTEAAKVFRKVFVHAASW